MAGTKSVEERVERLKALLTGQSDSARTVRALAAGGYGNLLLGVALHGADGKREGRPLTDLEGMLVDALGTIMEEAELKEWGRAYRETVQGAEAGTLIVPKVIAERPASSGFAIADLEQVLPGLSAEVAAAPNVSLMSLEDLAAGRQPDDPEFIDGMRECGFAVTGIARHPDSAAGTRSAGADGGTPLDSWRVRLEMEKFYVERAVGDQGGGRDEIYFTASSSAGGDGQTFTSEEFGAVKQGQTRVFASNKKVFLDEEAGAAGTAITSIQVWEADQSSSRWYDALQRKLNAVVEMIDSVLDTPGGIIADPMPLPVSFAYEIAKVFIGLMDALRNNDDLSHSAVFVLAREDMSVLYHRPELVWHFNGDGYHKLTVRYTGGRPVYPTGSIGFISRSQGDAPEETGTWSAPVPLGWKTKTAPRAAVYRDHLYVVFARDTDLALMWTRYDGTTWTPPRDLHMSVSDQPVALAAHKDQLHCLHTGLDGRVHHAWFNGTEWSPVRKVLDWETARGPALAEYDGALWAAFSVNRPSVRKTFISEYRADTGWQPYKDVQYFDSYPSAPALASCLDRMWTASTAADSVWEGLMTTWSVKGQGPGGTWLRLGDNSRGSRKPPVLHAEGQNLWLLWTSTQGRTTLNRRTDVTDASSGYWTPCESVGDSPWPTVLDTPALVMYRQRMYTIYHA
ncbi:hypothetical protein [Streptomyces albireticuli]|uniref:hypothetical protein n=1 Tax=Streptomyces albireticuli TaxID=1940 RepID=UPI003682CB9D